MDEASTLVYPGQVDFQYLKIVSSNGIVVDLNDYLIEFNLFEDIFSNFLHGLVMLNDSSNLISRLPILGDELLIVSYGTPGLRSYFQKVFQIYSVTDQKTTTDNNTQTYTLHFCSIEAIADANLVVYNPFSGLISDVAKTIFDTYLRNGKYVKFTPNDIELSDTDQSDFVLTPTRNNIKFISPGWSPAKCLNWLCSKSIPQTGKACDYLFWESTTGFFFASIENLLIESIALEKNAGEYYYIPPGNFETTDVVAKLFLAQSFEVVNFTDNLENYTNGFYANKIITYDPILKSYQVTNFDYPNEYDSFTHTEGNLSVPNFLRDVYRNPSTYAKLYSANSNLFTGTSGNYPERYKDVFGNRTSKLNELNNFKINLTVHGRSDLFVGAVIKFNYPDTTGQTNSSDSGTDMLFTGHYLVTAIRHKINFRTHVMVLELVKDSLVKKK